MKRMKQFTSLILSVVLVLTAPGLDFYRAFAQAPVKAGASGNNFSRSGSPASGASAPSLSFSASEIRNMQFLGGGFPGVFQAFQFQDSSDRMVRTGASKAPVSDASRILLESQEVPGKELKAPAPSTEAAWAESQVRFDGSLSRGEVLEGDAVRAVQGLSSGVSSRGPPSVSRNSDPGLEIAAPAAADSAQAVSRTSSRLKPVLTAGLAAALIAAFPASLFAAEAAQQALASGHVSVGGIDGGFRVVFDLVLPGLAERHGAFNLALPGVLERLQSVLSYRVHSFSLEGTSGKMAAIFLNAKNGGSLVISPSSLGYAVGNVAGFIFAIPQILKTIVNQGAKDMKASTLTLGLGASAGLFFVGVIGRDLFWGAQNFFGGGTWFGAYVFKSWFDVFKNAPEKFSAWKRKLLFAVHSHAVAFTWVAVPVLLGGLTYLCCALGLSVLAPNAPAFMTHKIFLFLVQSVAAVLFGILAYPSVNQIRVSKSAEGASALFFVFYSLISFGFMIWSLEQFVMADNGWDALRFLIYVATNAFGAYNTAEGAYLARKYRGNSAGKPKELGPEAKSLIEGARKGDAEAQFKLAREFEDISGPEVNEKNKENHESAFSWLIAAAGQGYVPAQLRLADKYLLGYGVKRDFVEAYKWYAVTAVRSRYGNLLALKMMEYLRGKMTEEQIGRAIDLANAQLPSTGDGPAFGRVVLED